MSARCGAGDIFLLSKLNLPHATVLLGHMTQLIPSVCNDADLAFGKYSVTVTACNLSGLGDVNKTGPTWWSGSDSL